MNANEIGTAKVTAISASLPSKIAKAQPSIPPDTKSCGTEPPIEIAPINTSSKLAPKIIPRKWFLNHLKLLFQHF